MQPDGSAIPPIAFQLLRRSIWRNGPTPDLDGSAVTIDILLPLSEWAVHQQDATLGPNRAQKCFIAKSRNAGRHTNHSWFPGRASEATFAYAFEKLPPFSRQAPAPRRRHPGLPLC